MSTGEFQSDFHPLGTQSAPCKVNLTLDVFPQRADGFHDLDSVVVQFQPGDQITCSYRVDTQQSIEMTCDDPSLPIDAGNLGYRAAQLFAERRGLGNFAIRIELQKRLPHQAGLGGGSSDAATVLRILSRRFPTKPEKLDEIAAALGSDVPLFLQYQPVRMRGRGEIIDDLDRRMPTLYGVLVKPGVGVPTGPAYQLLDAIRDRPPGTATERLLAVLQSKPNNLDALAAALGNDFEQAVLGAYPEVAAAHRAVTEAGALRALLCGSGSAIFGLARSRADAAAMAQTLRDENRYPWVEVAESIS